MHVILKLELPFSQQTPGLGGTSKVTNNISNGFVQVSQWAMAVGQWAAMRDTETLMLLNGMQTILFLIFYICTFPAVLNVKMSFLKKADTD